MACTTDGSWAIPSPPLVNLVAKVRRAVDCSSNRSFLRSKMAFTTVCIPYCSTDGSLERFFFCSSTAYPTVCVPYCSMAGTTAGSWGHPSHPPVDDFANVPRTVDCSRYRSFFRSSTAFTSVWAPYCSANVSADRPIFRLSTAFTTDGTQYCSFFRSSMAFTTVWVPYCSVNVSADRPIFRLSTAFTKDGTRYCSADGSGWQRIAHSCTRQRLSRRFSRRISQRMAADCSFLHSSTAFTMVFAPYFSADGSGLLILALVNGFHDGFRAVFLSGWRPIAHSFSRQRLSRRFARCIAQRMAAHCSYFLSSKAFMTDCAPYCSPDGSALLLLPLLNGFCDGLRSVMLSG